MNEIKSWRQRQREQQELREAINDSIKEFRATRHVDRINQYIITLPKIKEPVLTPIDRRKRNLIGLVFIMKSAHISEKSIANTLNISINTVRSYFSMGYRKLVR